MAVTISRAVGLRKGNSPQDIKRVPNEPEDVQKIQTLLKAVYAEPAVEITGLCQEDTIRAIGFFQSLWFSPDYVIEPDGTTLRKLNATATPVTLRTVNLDLIKRGGYSFEYDGILPPPPYRKLLYLATQGCSHSAIPDDTIDISDSKPERKGDHYALLLGYQELTQLLDVIAKYRLWGEQVLCSLYLLHGQHIIYQTNLVPLACPVQPYEEQLRPDLALVDPQRIFYYQAEEGKFSGRYFHPIPIAGRYYFAYYGGKFETDNMKRGFDCTTYVGSILHVDPYNGGMSSSMNLANQLGGLGLAVSIGMEGVSGTVVNEFFRQETKGTYIVWHPGHIVLVVEGIVHEFRNRRKGYCQTSAQNYFGARFQYHVRRVDVDWSVTLNVSVPYCSGPAERSGRQG